MGRVELKRGRRDAEDAKKTQMGGLIVWGACWASYRSFGGALLGPFLRTKVWKGGFLSGYRGENFLFLGLGGLREWTFLGWNSLGW